MHTEIRRAESFDLTTLSVALRQLRNLTLAAVDTLGLMPDGQVASIGSWPLPSLPIRPVADRLVPRRWGAHGAAQLGARRPERRHVRAADRGHRRGPQPSRVDAGHHRCARLDRHLGRRRPLRGPALPERPCRRPRGGGASAVRRGRRVLLRPDGRRDPGPRQRARPVRLRRVLARPRSRPAPGRVLRFRVPDGSTTVVDRVRGEVHFDNSTIEDFVLLRGNGTPMFLLANVVDDIEMGITDVVRAEEHLPNTPKQQMLWQRARSRAAGVGARAGAGQRTAQEAVEAARQGGPRAVPRRGLPRRRDGQLPDDARLDAAGRRRDRAVVATSKRRSGWRTSPTRRRSSTSRSSTRSTASTSGGCRSTTSSSGPPRSCRPMGPRPLRGDRAAHPGTAGDVRRGAGQGRFPVLALRRPNRLRRGVVGQGVRRRSGRRRCSTT